MNEMSSVALVLLIAFVGGQIARRLNYPRVVGQLILSLVLGIPVIKSAFSSESISAVRMFSELGAILLLFLTGFEVNFTKLKQAGREAVIISIAAAVIPFLSGFLLGSYLNLGLKASLILGGCISVTAEATTIAFLLELKKVNTRVGSIMLGAGIVDDIFEVLFLAMAIVLTSKTGSVHIAALSLRTVAFVILFFVSLRFIPMMVHRIEGQKDNVSLFNAILAFGLAVAIITQLAGAGALIGAFVAGIFIHRAFMDKHDLKEEECLLRIFSFGFIVPFFFIYIGLQFDYGALFANARLVLLVLASAFFGKMAGVLVTKPFVRLSWRQLALIGWAMNSRGVMELIIAQIALSHGLISPSLYSAIVLMAVITTVIFPIVLRNMIHNTPGIMDKEAIPILSKERMSDRTL